MHMGIGCSTGKVYEDQEKAIYAYNSYARSLKL